MRSNLLPGSGEVSRLPRNTLVVAAYSLVRTLAQLVLNSNSGKSLKGTKYSSYPIQK